MPDRPDQSTSAKDCMQDTVSDLESVAKMLAAQTNTVLAYVQALESAPAPSDETLRTRICV